MVEKSTFERFTERARQAVVLAQEEARSAGTGYIDDLALLAGLVREEEGLAARALGGLVPDGKLLVEVRKELAGRAHTPSSWRDLLPIVPQTKKALERALREALQLGHNYIGTEHILLGLVRYDDQSSVVGLLNHCGIDQETVHAEVIRLLTRPKRVTRSTLDTTTHTSEVFPAEVWLAQRWPGGRSLILMTDPNDAEAARRSGWRVRHYQRDRRDRTYRRPQ